MHNRSPLSFIAALLLSGLLITGGAGAAIAATDQQQQLTLKQAIDMAKTDSSTLKVAQDTIDQKGYTRDAKSQAVSFTPTGQTTSDNEQAFLSLVQADIDLRSAKQSYQASEDSVVYQVYQAYDSILQDQVALNSDQQAFNLADRQLRSTTLNNQFGGASKLQVQQAKESLAAAQSSLTAADKTLTTAYEKFNQLVGLMPGDRPNLIDQPAFAPLEIDSLDAEVNRVLAASPTVLQAQQSVNKAKIALNIYSFSSTDINTYQGTEKGIDIAQQNASSTQDSVAQSLRNLYYSILQLEASHESLQQNLATAELNLKIAQVQYDTGAASAIVLATAQSAYTQAEQALINNTCQHQLQVQAFETPWASTS